MMYMTVNEARPYSPCIRQGGSSLLRPWPPAPRHPVPVTMIARRIPQPGAGCSSAPAGSSPRATARTAR